MRHAPVVGLSARQILQQEIQRRGGERVHVGQPVGAASFQRHGRRLRADDRHAAMAGGVAIAVAGRSGRAGFGQAPIGGKAQADPARQQLRVDFRGRADPLHRVIRDVHQDPPHMARIDQRRAEKIGRGPRAFMRTDSRPEYR
jgi:hypothetical protein